MVDIEYAKEWFRFAEVDLSSAKHLWLTHRPKPLEIICYLSQQSAEKSLKGLLVLNGTTPPKIHNLLELQTFCEPFVTNTDTIVKQCNTLNRYCVMPRYPNEIEILDYDAEQALDYAKFIFDFVSPHFPQKNTNQQ